MSHWQRFLVDVVANRQCVVSDVLKKMMSPHIAQFVLRKSGGEIGGGIAPRTAFECKHLQTGIAQLLRRDGSGPAKSHEYCINGFEGGRHACGSRQPGRPLKLTG